MSFYQVVAVPRRASPRKPQKPFIDRRLYTEVYQADERSEELAQFYPHYEVQIIVVSA